MRNITDILTDFFAIMKDDILEYYHLSHSYLKDLITYKKFDLNRKTVNEREKNLYLNLKKILKAIRTGLNTIGVPINELNENEKDFMESLEKNRAEIQDYNTYLQIYLKNYVNKILFNILIDYLLEVDTKKLENINIFDLLPPYFISNLNDLKKKHFNTPEIINLFKRQDFDNYINFSDLTLKSGEASELNILKKLREAKQDIIETLNLPQNELITLQMTPPIDKTILKEKILLSKTTTLPEQDLHTELISGTFLDYFGQFPPINIDIKNRFSIKKNNLIKSKEFNKDFFDLENLYHYNAILKMLNINFPFTNGDLLGTVRNYINGKIFSSSKEDLPDSKNIFYGLALFSELNLLNQTDLIDLQEIEKYLKSEIENFIPEKLEFNLYLILCIKLLGKNCKIKFNRKLILELLLKINLSTIEDFTPSLDIFNYLALIKLLDKEINLKQFEIISTNELKKLLTSDGSINDSITESARVLLIFDLLNSKNREPELCDKLLNYILNITDFFNTNNLDENFNWQNDKFGFKIELEILYWALLSSSQYISKNS